MAEESAGLLPSEMKWLPQLEEENGKLKRIVADLWLDEAMLQDVLSRKLQTGQRRRWLPRSFRASRWGTVPNYASPAGVSGIHAA